MHLDYRALTGLQKPLNLSPALSALLGGEATVSLPEPHVHLPANTCDSFRVRKQ